MQVYITRGAKRTGPFDLEAITAGLATGAYDWNASDLNGTSDPTRAAPMDRW